MNKIFDLTAEISFFLCFFTLQNLFYGLIIFQNQPIPAPHSYSTIKVLADNNQKVLTF